MFRHKKHLFFDLDHTLWDFEANAEKALEEIFEAHKLKKSGVSFDRFYTTFSVLNKKLWKELEQKTISHNYIRKQRFIATLAELKVNISEAESEEMNNLFLALLPKQKLLISGAQEILTALKPHYNLHILSNGYKDVQEKKMQNSGIAPYFDKLITNDLANASKPDKVIYDYALKITGAETNEALMIGDNYEADILGAKRAGLETVHYSTEGHLHENESTIKITRLEDILDYL